jgi:hypothetical protein
MITTSAHMTYCWLSIHALMRGTAKGTWLCGAMRV